MKKWKSILILAFCLSLAQIPAFSPDGPIVAEAAEKTGLQQEGGNYYFYTKKGELKKNKWKTVKTEVNGSVVKYRYYFGSDGIAYKGEVRDGILVPAIASIDGKDYAFDQYGRMLTGVFVRRETEGYLFYAFSADTGALDTAATASLRAAAKEGTAFSALTKLLKQMGVSVQKKQTGLDSCYGDGTDLIFSYPGFDVQGFKNRTTKVKTVVSVVTTAAQTTGPVPPAGGDTPETDTPETEKPSGSGGDADEPKKSGLTKINGKYYFFNKKGVPVTNKWKTVNGYLYYFGEKGKAKTGSAKVNGKFYLFNQKGKLQNGAGDRFKKVNGKLYYVNEHGQPYTGWLVINGGLYYATFNGALLQNSSVLAGSITFDGNGKANDSTDANLKITTMELIAGITNDSMTQEQKLKACWDFMVDSKHFTYYPRTVNLTQKGWQRQAALDMFKTRAGNCYSFACAFAALASQIGYRPYVVAGRVTSNGSPRDDVGDGMTPHCWIVIDNKYYDPEAQFKGWMTGVYGLPVYAIGHKEQYKAEF